MQKNNFVPEISRRTFLVGGSVVGAVSVGPFAQAAAQITGSDTRLVQTSGYASGGRGAALYVHDAAVDGRYVAANPRSSFVTQDGRGFRLSLDQTVTPYMFGAVGNANFTASAEDFSDLSDDTLALQAFFDFCAANIVIANWSGAFGVTAPLTIGGAFGEDQLAYRDTGSFEGAMYLGVKSNINGAVIYNQARRQAHFGPIHISGPGTGYPDYSKRLFDVGIDFRDRALAQTWEGIYVGYARIAGVLIRNRTTASDNVFHNDLRSCFFYGCGGGSNFPSLATVTTTYSGHVRTGPNGGGDAVFQRSTLTVPRATLPPVLLEDAGLPTFVRAAGRLHHVMSLDRRTGAVSLYPELAAAMGATGRFEWIFGGGLCIVGGDSGITTGKVSSQNCSAGYIAGSAYNGHVVATLQDNYIGLLIGRNIGHVSNEGTTNLYVEGNTIDILWNADNRASQASHTITSYQNFNQSKVKSFTPRLGDDSLAPFQAQALMINLGERWAGPENTLSINGVYESHVCEFDQPYAYAVPLHNDNPSITIAPSQLSLFGYRAQRYDITGSGSGNRPVGTLTVRNPGGGKTINGGPANVDFIQSLAASTGPVSVQVAVADNGNYLVSIITGITDRAAAQPNSTAPDVAALVSDFNTLLAKLRAAGVIAP